MEGKVVEMQKKENEKVKESTQQADAKVNNNTPAPHKLSYEQLASAAQQLSEQGRQLYKRVQELENQLEEANLANLYKKLDYLWNVIHSDSIYLNEDFRISCGKEFMQLMQGKTENETVAPDTATEKVEA